MTIEYLYLDYHIRFLPSSRIQTKKYIHNAFNNGELSNVKHD